MRGYNAALTTTAAARESLQDELVIVGFQSVLVGIGTAPILIAPKKANTISGASSISSTTRSSGRMPSLSRSARPTG